MTKPSVVSEVFVCGSFQTYRSQTDEQGVVSSLLVDRLAPYRDPKGPIVTTDQHSAQQEGGS